MIAAIESDEDEQEEKQMESHFFLDGGTREPISLGCFVFVSPNNIGLILKYTFREEILEKTGKERR